MLEVLAVAAMIGIFIAILIVVPLLLVILIRELWHEVFNHDDRDK